MISSRPKQTPTRSQLDVLVGASNLKVPKSELDLYPNLKMVADFGVGYDGFDTAEIIRRGLRFSIPLTFSVKTRLTLASRFA